MAVYGYPEVLVTAEPVAGHGDDLYRHLVNVDVDITTYEKGHAKNGAGWNRTTQLDSHVRRDISDQRQFE